MEAVSLRFLEKLVLWNKLHQVGVRQPFGVAVLQE
jgi:hypothetical protein